LPLVGGFFVFNWDMSNHPQQNKRTDNCTPEYNLPSFIMAKQHEKKSKTDQSE
jgi:hypothetical protein